MLPLPLRGLVPFIPPVRITLPALRGRPLTAPGPPKRPIPITYILHNPPRLLPFCFNPHFFSPGDGSRHDKSLLNLQHRPSSKQPRRAPTADARFLDGRRSGAATLTPRKIDSTRVDATLRGGLKVTVAISGLRIPQLTTLWPTTRLQPSRDIDDDAIASSTLAPTTISTFISDRRFFSFLSSLLLDN